MSENIIVAIGGIGLFLLGMVMLTDGLRDLSGNALRRFLARYTETPAKGALAGALTTAVIQSSSATTVTAVGFVGAGLLTFPQGLGIVFGANIGTTATGWLVALLGFKLKIGSLALPLVFAGALARLFAPGRWRHAGWAAAGFGLLFVGIAMMQDGMAAFQGTVSAADFPDDTLLGRLQLVLIGIAVTLITQSSSAGVATALVALNAGAISLPQAAAMVIGMDVGTTFTAVLATVGGSTAMRQTGYAHVFYNLLTAAIGFMLLDLLVMLAGSWAAPRGSGDAQMLLVAFHTSFNIVGVALILPFAGPFGRVIERLVPDRSQSLTGRLDRALLSDPATAVDAVKATVEDISNRLFEILEAMLPSPAADIDEALSDAEHAVIRTRDFVERIRTEPSDRIVHARHLAAMHALDHAHRLVRRFRQHQRIAALGGDRSLRRLARVLGGVAGALHAEGDGALLERKADRLRVIMRRQRGRYRERVIAATARHDVDAETALVRLDAMRWMHRVAYHLWRMQLHLNLAAAEDATQPQPESDAASEVRED